MLLIVLLIETLCSTPGSCVPQWNAGPAVSVQESISRADEFSRMRYFQTREDRDREKMTRTTAARRKLERAEFATPEHKLTAEQRGELRGAVDRYAREHAGAVPDLRQVQ